MPKEGPTPNELPQRPFGLLQLDNLDSASVATDDQSMAGSIILRPNDTISLAQTSRTNSEAGDLDR